MSRSITNVKKYQPLNQYLERIREGETIWRIQGDRGLRPVIADTKEEAIEKYLAIPRKNY
ncbi:hypothetical protein ABZ714_14310 [Streptomyces sp. NPDC006798]|uniref:hypothetical protein n=1 Tax=unclassified Streptomyces TaxID=2593676 RepID=UPI0033DC7711